MIPVGIDTLAIYIPQYALDLVTLAKARHIDPDKYLVGLGQQVMAVVPPDEDIITMAANALEKILPFINIEQIDMVLFATESGIDQSKAAGLYLHELFNLPARCRIIELKQACYAATGAIQLALPSLREQPDKKILVIASDIARYGLNTPGESSAGAGAIAMLLSAHPRLLAIEPQSGILSANIMDFWRPNYKHEALVDGKYSSRQYINALEKSFREYSQLSQHSIQDHAYFCYHTPVPRLVEKAHQHLLKTHLAPIFSYSAYETLVTPSLHYARQIGNTYTASLYISLASLLDSSCENLAGKRVGFYSYGSGCIAEYFSGVIQTGYENFLLREYHHHLISNRQFLNYQEYEYFYQFHYNENGEEQLIPAHLSGKTKLIKIAQHKRIYQRSDSLTEKKENISHRINAASQAIQKICAPAKLILSGEHAVVYGCPALAMAINRYTSATITQDTSNDVQFDLTNLAHKSHLSLTNLKFLKNKIKRKYQRFINGEYSIREVLQKPFELAQVALGMITDTLNLSLPHGVNVKVQSDIPIGCGMGSSAAIILSIMKSLAAFLHIPLSEEKLLQLALEAENMQHGHSSGLDLRIALQGGCLYFQGERIETRALPLLPMYLINTGVPASSTGQCVEKVAPFFTSQELRDEFTIVTNTMDQALQAASWQTMQNTIQSNHRLLTRIGVVPKRVQQFISEIELSGGAAKICGAGSIQGDQAGAVLAVHHDPQTITHICNYFAYEATTISGDLRGLHAA